MNTKFTDLLIEACDSALDMGFNVSHGTFYTVDGGQGIAARKTCICPVIAVLLQKRQITRFEDAVEFLQDHSQEDEDRWKHEIDEYAESFAYKCEFDGNEDDCGAECSDTKSLSDYIIHMVDEHGYGFQQLAQHLARFFAI